ncbi:unnamed protein product [Jaminaea pallidilutea]
MPTSCTCAPGARLPKTFCHPVNHTISRCFLPLPLAYKTLRHNIFLSTYRGVSCLGRLLAHSQSVRSKTTERKAGTNMASALRILHPPASASNTSPHPIIILNNGSRKAIFNAPEGTIRTNSTRKAGISGSKGDLDIYLQDATLATGGLPGLLMTLSDVSSDGRHNVHLYGPPSSAYALATARFFAKRTSRQLWVHEANDLLGSESVWPVNRSSGQEAVRAIPTWPQSWSPSAAVSSLAPHLTDESSSSTNSSSSGSNSSKKRRRQPSSQDDRDCENVEQGDKGEARRLNGSANTDEQTPMYGAPTSNAEYDAYISTRTQGDSNADADTENGVPDATAIAIATAQDMFKRSSTQSGPRGVQLDDPSAVPRGKGITPAWNASRLPRPAISAVSSARDQIATQPIAISYAITLPSLLGKVDATKAALLGVFPGPDIGSLQSGKAVTIRRPVDWSSWSEQDRQKWSSTRGGTKSKGKKARKDGVGAVEGDSSSIVRAPALDEVSIQPSECVAAPQSGPVVFLVFLPSPSHIEAFLSDQNVARLDEATKDSAGKASLIIHTSPISVLTDKRYQDWLAERSNAQTQHVFTTSELGRDLILFPSSALGLLRMSILDDKMFRFPPYRLQRRQELLAACLPANVPREQVTIADRDTTVDLQPRFGRPQLTTNIWQAHGDDVTYDVEAPEGTKDYAAKIAKMAFEDDSSEVRDDQVRKAVLRKERHAAWLEYLEAAKRARADVQELTANGQAPTDAKWEGIKVTTLGTGSAAPSKYRSVAATLVQLPGRLFATGAHGRDEDPVYVLLDAGEGTLGQLTQRFGGGQELDTILARIRILFVSHIHGDHCAGVARVLRARAELKPTQPLYLVSNVFTRQFLQEWNDLQDIGLPTRTDGNDGQCDGSVPDSERASVVMLESEHLDYTFGVGRKAEDDGDYIAHLESGYRPGYERWRERLRQEVIAQPAFANDAPSSEIDEEVQKLAEQRNPSLRGGKEPSFGHSARKQYDVKREARHMTRDGLKRLHQDLGHGVDLTTVEVDHRARHCYGIVMRMRGSGSGEGGGEGDGAVEASNDAHSRDLFSFSYSGDTRPTARLEKAAANVDLYIHEATMQEEEASEAYARGHSTIRGAIQSGRRAGARVILLTHFSQRYPKMARIGESMALDGQDTQSSGGSSSSNGRAVSQPATVAIGMDLLEMEMNDMWKMERYLPAIEVLYNAEAAGDGGEAGEGREVGEAVVDGQADVVMKDGGN